MNQEEGFISIIFIYYWANSVVDICLLFVSFLLLVVLPLSNLICTLPVTILAFSQCSVLSSLFLVLSCLVISCFAVSCLIALCCYVLYCLFHSIHFLVFSLSLCSSLLPFLSQLFLFDSHLLIIFSIVI